MALDHVRSTLSEARWSAFALARLTKDGTLEIMRNSRFRGRPHIHSEHSPEEGEDVRTEKTWGFGASIYVCDHDEAGACSRTEVLRDFDDDAL